MHKKYENQTMPDEVRFNLVNEDIKNDAEVLRKLAEAKAKNETLTGYCSSCEPNGDLIIDLSPNIKGVIPRNEVTYKVEKDGNVHKGKCESRVMMNVQFKVKEIKEEGEGIKVILSRKEAVEEVKRRYEKELEKGMIVKGVVTGIQSYGAYVDIGGDVEGIISVGNVSRVYLHDPSEILKVGQVVDVVIEDIIKENGEIKLVLNRKVLLPTFQDIDKYFKQGQTVPGRVKEIIDTGIFVEICKDGVRFEGLAEFVPGRTFKYGDPVRVKIHSFNKSKEKLRLRIK